MAGQNEASQLQPKAFASPQRVCKYVATVVVALALGAAVLGSGAATSAIKTLASFRIMGTPEVDTRSILASSDQACSRGATCLEASTQGDYAERDKPWDTDCFCTKCKEGYVLNKACESFTRYGYHYNGDYCLKVEDAENNDIITKGACDNCAECENKPGTGAGTGVTCKSCTRGFGFVDGKCSVVCGQKGDSCEEFGCCLGFKYWQRTTLNRAPYHSCE
mmetsp:Transcript_34137/g.104891  ORF Transcript_34137/g.104891 Transcript_34137/m.104891 type:complete len:220 (+) Transcript_34137:955-1614(+)